MYCSNCGEKIPENANYCQKCGKRISVNNDKSETISDNSSLVYDDALLGLDGSLSWEDFYDHFYSYSDDINVERLNEIDGLGSPDEIVEVAIDLVIGNEDISNKLIRTALKQGVKFSLENIMDAYTNALWGVDDEMLKCYKGPMSIQQMDEFESMGADIDILEEVYRKSKRFRY